MFTLIAAIIIAAPCGGKPSNYHGVYPDIHAKHDTITVIRDRVVTVNHAEIRKHRSRAWIVIPAFIGGAVLAELVHNDKTKYVTITKPCPTCHKDCR